MGKICKPKVTSSTEKPYTKVSWLPDYERFGLEGLSDDMFQMFKKRTWDISAVTDKSIKVKFNNKVVPVKTFESYNLLNLKPSQYNFNLFSNKYFTIGNIYALMKENIKLLLSCLQRKKFSLKISSENIAVETPPSVK